MKTFWRRLHRTCLPFVTRSLRGHRLRRTIALSLLLAVVSVFTGAWLALGRGSFERDIRVAFDLETSQWDRTRTEHSIVVHDDYELAEVRRHRADVLRHGFEHAPEWGTVQHTMREGAATLHAAVLADAPVQHRALQDRARALLDDGGERMLDESVWYQRTFEWDRPEQVALLTDIVEVGLVPRVERYRSPLGPSGAITLAGLVGGGVLVFGLLVIGPLMVGTQIAQEVHENTLQPLLGTALSARSLVVGQSSGPLAVLALILAPQVAMLLVASIAVGNLLAGVGTIVTASVGCALFSMTCALAGLAIGRKQSPGLVGTALLSLLTILFFVGLAVGFNLEGETLGMLTIMPQAGTAHLLREALAPAGHLDQGDAFAADVRLVVSVIVFFVLTAITLYALERRVADRSGPTLRRKEAIVAAATLVVASVLAMPNRYGFEEVHVLGSLALVVLPFMLLAMGRVPIGRPLHGDADDHRTSRRRVLGCLAEFAGFVALHAVVATTLAGGFWTLEGLGPAAVFHVSWGLAVAALVAIRMVTVPLRLAGLVYLSFCLVMAVTAYFTGTVFACDQPSTAPLFALTHLSPVLGAIQAVLTVVIPWSLLRVPRQRPDA
jgi:hypothetical protein